MRALLLVALAVASPDPKLTQSAVEAAIWGMRIVSFDAMRQAFFRDAGAQYGDIVYRSIPTPGSLSLYVYFNFNLKDGPVILDIPAANGAELAGSLNDAWQRPMAGVGPAGEDEGKGGQYLLLAPDDAGTQPKFYIPVHAPTYNGCALLRAIPASAAPADVAKALDLVRQIRIYPLGQADEPPSSRHIDIAGKPFRSTPAFDDTFYDSMARMVNEESVAVPDYVRSLGIEKGKPFHPDAATRALLRHAIEEAHAQLMQTALP
jgi:hypothetical protein